MELKLLLAIVALLANAMLARAGVDWLEMIPENVAAALVVRDVRTLDINVHRLAKKIGRPLPPFMSVSVWQDSVGLGSWSIEEGTACIPFDDAFQDVVVILPVKDREQALRDLQAQARGEFYEGTLLGEQRAILAIDRYLIIGNTNERLKPFRAGFERKKWTKDERQLYAESSVFYWSTGSALGEITEVLDGSELVEFISGSIAPDDQRTIANWWMERSSAFWGGIETGAYSARISENAAVLDAVITFRAGTGWLPANAGAPISKSNLMAGLPSGPCYSLTAFDIRTFRDPIRDELAKFFALPTVKNDLAIAKWELLFRQFIDTVDGIAFGGYARGDDRATVCRMETKTPDLDVRLLDRFVDELRKESPIDDNRSFVGPTVVRDIDGISVRQVDFQIDGLPVAYRSQWTLAYGQMPRLQWGAQNGSIMLAFSGGPDPFKLVSNSSRSLESTSAVQKSLADLLDRPFMVNFSDELGSIHSDSEAISISAPSPAGPRSGSLLSMAASARPNGIHFRWIAPAEVLRPGIENALNFSLNQGASWLKTRSAN